MPRHPTQIYEALAGFILIGISLWLEKRRAQFKDGFILYVLLFFYFSARFSVEFFKEYQTLEASVPLTMGQWLSLPIVVLTLVMAYRLRGAPPPRPEPSTAPKGPKPRPASVRSVRKKGKKAKRR